MPPRKPKQARSLTLSDLEQVRILADPLRLRILEELCTAERTTKQVAQRLGEKPTKLYHHVEALERVGLIRLARTRPNRGTIEKYYQAVARQFRTDSRLFSRVDARSETGGGALQEMISTVFDRTADEVRGAIARGDAESGIAEEGVISHLEIRVAASEGRRIKSRLMKLIQSLEETPGARRKSAERRYRLTLAFFPLDTPTDD